MPTDIIAFIAYLGSPGFLQWAFSVAMDQWPWFQRQDPLVKKVCFIAAAVGFSMGSWYVLDTVSEEVLHGFNEQFRALALTIQVALTWGVGEQAHDATKKREEKKVAAVGKVEAEFEKVEEAAEMKETVKVAVKEAVKEAVDGN